MKVIALAGGVGGAKLVDGLSKVLQPASLTVVVNTGDDFDHFGLRVCPDLDTVCYTLAGLASRETGWGHLDDTWTVMETLGALGGPVWFRVGDRDLATSLERTRLLGEGYTLSEITLRFCSAWGVRVRVLPMADAPFPTTVISDEGELNFQEYFVKRHCEPRVSGFRFGIDTQADAAPGVINALTDADLVVICPSNPWVSIDPILALPGIRNALETKPVIAVSPIIGGKAVKGPAAKMFLELSILPTPGAVAEHYTPFLDALVIDRADEPQADEIRRTGLDVLVTETLMTTPSERERLARQTLEYGGRVLAP